MIFLIDLMHGGNVRFMRVAIILGLAAGIPLMASQRPPAREPVPLLNDPAITEIQKMAREKSPYDFTGLAEYDHGSMKVLVFSNRAEIAYKTAVNPRYAPSPEDRLDTVQIRCGDPDLMKLLGCQSVRVTLPDKTEIRPVSYDEEPKTYEDSSGVRWTSHEIRVIYSARDLSDGFVVDYVYADGIQDTLTVSPETARDSLLLKIDNSPARPIV